eukprot:2004463-Alexandrium_andersonii.AAC.1
MFQLVPTESEKPANPSDPAAAYCASFASMPMNVPGDSLGGELLSNSEVDSCMMETAKQRSIFVTPKRAQQGPCGASQLEAIPGRFQFAHLDQCPNVEC